MMLCIVAASYRGGMAEWLKAVVLKTTDGVTRPGVRIPLPPPFFCPAKSSLVQKINKISMETEFVRPLLSVLVH